MTCFIAKLIGLIITTVSTPQPLYTTSEMVVIWTTAFMLASSLGALLSLAAVVVTAAIGG